MQPAVRRRRGPGVAAVALALSAIGALGPGEPTGGGWADAVLRAAATATLALAGAAAGPVALVGATLAGTGLSLLDPVATPLAVASLLVALVARHRAERPALGAAAGGTLALALAQLDLPGPLGTEALATALVGAVVLGSALDRSATARRAAGWLLPTIAAAGVLAVAGFGAALVGSLDDLRDGVDLAEAGVEAARDGDAEGARAAFAEAAGRLRRSADALDAPWARAVDLVPVVAQHARLARGLAADAAELSEVASDAAAAVDDDLFRVQGGRIDLDRVAAVRPDLEALEARVAALAATLGEAEGPWLLGPVADGLEDLADDVGELSDDIATAREAAEALPVLLGAEAPAHHLLVLTDPAEARGLGGAVAVWAELVGVDGRLLVTDAGPAAEIDGLLAATGFVPSEPADFVARHRRWRQDLRFRDATSGPDLPSVASVLAQLYEAATGRPVDGVVVADPAVVASLVDLTGPVALDDGNLVLDGATTEEFLLRGQYVRYAGDDARREEVLEDLIVELARRLGTVDLPGPRTLGDRLGPLAREGRLLATVDDPAGAAFLDRLGVGGALPDPQGGDLVAVVHQASGPELRDAGVQRRIGYEITVRPGDGTVTAQLEVTLGRASVAGGGTDQTAAAEQLHLTVYSPLDLVGAAIAGTDLAVDAGRELGLQVYSADVTVPAGGEVTVALELGGRLDLAGGSYRIIWAGQPLTRPDTFVLQVGGPDGEILAEREWTGPSDHGLVVPVG